MKITYHVLFVVKLFVVNMFMLAMIVVSNTHAHGLLGDRLERVTRSVESLPSTASAEDKARLLLERGRVYQQGQDWQHALSDYRDALILSPLLYDVYYWQGVLYTEQQDFIKAQRSLEAYLRRVPESPDGHIALAELKHLQRDYYYAVAHYNLAIRHDPKSAPDTFIQRAKSLQNIKPVPLTRIEWGIREGYAVHGALVSLVSTLIEIKVKFEDYQGALDEFAYLSEKIRVAPKWQVQEAELLALVGDKVKSLERYQAAVQSIDALSSHRRLTEAMTELREQSQREIARLTRM
ncbi:MAG: hypothetical protein COA42_05705 [Alteromonadaceae bacterium]|nr:MAG: hypothetical protein COA42_05705 [Alteromonadaceae bacterium]